MTFSTTKGYDISYYQGAVNFQQMKAYGAKFVVIRCGYANVKDIRFDEYMGQVTGVLPVSTYHYYDPLINPSDQARKIIDTLYQYKSRINRVWLDFEFYWAGSYSGPEHWLNYRNQIENAGYKTGIYTRATWWDSRVGTYAAEFAKRPLWAAQYNTALTLIPKGWTKAMLWQKGTPAEGIAAGVSSKEIDLDLWNDDYNFAAEWGTSTQPPADVTTTPYAGMTRISGKRNGWKFELFKIDPAKWRFEVVYLSTPETVSSVVRRKGATAGWNAGDYNRFTYVIQDWLVSNGVEIVKRDPMGGRPSFQVQKDTNNVFVDTYSLRNIQQAFTGIRPLVQLGTVDTSLYNDSEAQNTEGHARFVFCVDGTGNPMLFSSEGIHPSLTVFDGLKLREAAAIVQGYGAWTAGDGGGGGDVTCILDGQSLIVPENIDDNGNHFERPLPMVLLAYKIGDTMDGIAKEKLGNLSKVRKTPSRYGVEAYSLAAYAQVNFTQKVDTVPQGGADDPREMWLQLTDGNFVNYKLYNTAGVLTEMFSIIQEPSVTPPPSGDVVITTIVNVTAKTVHVDKPQDWTEI